jgi:hypothetical protein
MMRAERVVFPVPPFPAMAMTLPKNFFLYFTAEIAEKAETNLCKNEPQIPI